MGVTLDNKVNNTGDEFNGFGIPKSHFHTPVSMFSSFEQNPNRKECYIWPDIKRYWL